MNVSLTDRGRAKKWSKNIPSGNADSETFFTKASWLFAGTVVIGYGCTFYQVFCVFKNGDLTGLRSAAVELGSALRKRRLSPDRLRSPRPICLVEEAVKRRTRVMSLREGRIEKRLRLSVPLELSKLQDPNGMDEALTESTGSRSASGFLLVDSSLNPIWFNAEAIQILGYPDNPAPLTCPEAFLGKKIQSTLLNKQAVGGAPLVTEFRSGRRNYFCRAFLMDTDSKNSFCPSIVALLERGLSRLLPLSQVSQKFDLTQRELELLEYLVEGMDRKTIGNRMKISPSTVNAFLRLIMMKMGVSSRWAVVGKIIMSQPY